MTYAYRIHLFYSAQTCTYKYIPVNKKDILMGFSVIVYTGRTENSKANLIKY